MKLILGSGSKPRKKVLDENGYQFEVMSPDIDEKAIRTDDHYALPSLLARAKSDALLSRINEPVIVITADQVVVCNKSLHEKPMNLAEAKAFLKKYNDGHPAETVSALTVVNTVNGKRSHGVDIAKTFFNPIPDSVIEDFVAQGDPLSKAGGFCIESVILAPYIARIEGAKDSVLGMPLNLLEKLISEVE